MLVRNDGALAGDGGGGEERAAGGLRRRLPVGEGAIGSDRTGFVSCCASDRHVNMYCGPELASCYCCMTLPGCPCYAEQQECWDFCPVAPTRSAAPSPSAPLPARRSGDDGTVVSRCSLLDDVLDDVAFLIKIKNFSY
jgi:hypothetical protein